MKQEIVFYYKLKDNDLMNKKHKNVCKALNYFEHFPIFNSAVSGSNSIFAFASLIGVCIGHTSSAVRLKLCDITAGIKKYKSILEKIN